MAAASLVLAFALPVLGQDLRFFRIGTGGTGGTYFPIASLIAHAISEPPGAPPCPTPGNCGVPGLVVSAIATPGSVANVEAVQGGQMESAFVQGDVAAWAYRGKGIWRDRPAAEKLRAIAALYPETIHLVASRSSGIASIQDLRGKRVSVDAAGSGTLVDARIILAAAGLSDTDMQQQHLTLPEAAQAMRQGDLDAFFFLGGAPAVSISELANSHDITIIPIDDKTARAVIKRHAFFQADQLPAHSYEGQDSAVPTLSVRAIWVTSADQPETLIHAMTQALFSPRTREELSLGHSKAREIAPDTALQGLALPLHPGAMRYYQQAGLLRQPAP